MSSQGGAAGSATGKGVVYCLKDDKQFKLGCTSDLDRRLKEIKGQPGRQNTKFLFDVGATEMCDAESAAQRRTQKKLGFKKIDAGSGAIEWFNNPKRASHADIKKEIQNAVYADNRKQKKKQKQNTKHL